MNQLNPASGRGRRVPWYVWTFTGIGLVGGVLLAEDGDVVGNTLPSALTFALAGLVVGSALWAIVAAATRSRRR